MLAHNSTNMFLTPGHQDQYLLGHQYSGSTHTIVINDRAIESTHWEAQKACKTSESRSELKLGPGATLSLQVIGGDRLLLLNFDGSLGAEPWSLYIGSVTVKGLNPHEDISEKEEFIWLRHADGEEVGYCVVRYGVNASLSVNQFGAQYQPYIATALRMIFLQKHHELYEELESFTTAPFGLYYTRRAFPMTWEDHDSQVFELARLEETLSYNELHTGLRRYQWVRTKWIPITDNLWCHLTASNAHKELWNFYPYGMPTVLSVPDLNRVWGETWKKYLTYHGRIRLELLESTVACIKELMYTGNWDLHSTFHWLTELKKHWGTELALTWSTIDRVLELQKTYLPKPASPKAVSLQQWLKAYNPYAAPRVW